MLHSSKMPNKADAYITEVLDAGNDQVQDGITAMCASKEAPGSNSTSPVLCGAATV
jgi:hypothetical protein